MFDAENGTIFDSTVTGIQPSKDGIPGSKNARYVMNNVQGNIEKNTKKGIFGKYIGEIVDKKLYKVAKFNEIKLGEAKILTVLNGDKIESYTINITRINEGPIKNILFEINDSKLLNKAGGIVQGMSGSPIIQNEKIIGAITHVVIDNPIKGYGIYIGSMLEETN